MPANVDSYFRILINGNAPIDQAQPVTVTATDDISFDLPVGSADLPIGVQPGPATAIVFMAVSVPHGSAGISYRPSVAGSAMPLDGTHCYSGPGMAALLGANPTVLHFSNSGSADVPVRIVVARNG